MGRWLGIELYLYIIFGVSKHEIRCCEGDAHVPHFGLFFRSRRAREALERQPSDLLGAGSIWSSNVDSASMWIWIGPSGWWIGVDLRLI